MLACGRQNNMWRNKNAVCRMPCTVCRSPYAVCRVPCAISRSEWGRHHKTAHHVAGRSCWTAPTLLHHDTVAGDDVRVSAGLLATPDKDAMSRKQLIVYSW